MNKQLRRYIGLGFAGFLLLLSVGSAGYSLFFASPEQRSFAWQGAVIAFIVVALISLTWGKPHVARGPRG